MRFLLDTVTFLWLVEGSNRLAGPTRVDLLEPTNDVWLSAVSAWEIAVKHRLGQALRHGLTIVTPDESIRSYPVPTLW